MVARLVNNRSPSWAGTRPAPTFYWSVGQICVPYEVVLEKPSFQEKTRFQFVGVYTKNSCWMSQRVRHPTAISGSGKMPLLQIIL